MKRIDNRILFGVLLIAIGFLFIFQEFGLISSAWGILWAGIFGIAGAVFLYAYFTHREQWWPLIPGTSLIAIGILILLTELLPQQELDWAGMIVLGGIGLSFWLVYLLHREQWWAIIPGGVLLTLAVVSVTDQYLEESAGVFFLGLGLTFVLVALLPTPQGQMKWAYIPAIILVVMGVLLTPLFQQYALYVVGAGLILAGIYILLRNLRA